MSAVQLLNFRLQAWKMHTFPPPQYAPFGCRVSLVGCDEWKAGVSLSTHERSQRHVAEGRNPRPPARGSSWYTHPARV